MLNFTSDFLSNNFNHISYNRLIELIGIAAKQLIDNILSCDCRMRCIMKDRKSFEIRITSMDCKAHFFGLSMKLIFIIVIILNIQINKCKQ
jgi:hypothetical protein